MKLKKRQKDAFETVVVFWNDYSKYTKFLKTKFKLLYLEKYFCASAGIDFLRRSIFYKLNPKHMAFKRKTYLLQRIYIFVLNIALGLRVMGRCIKGSRPDRSNPCASKWRSRASKVGVGGLKTPDHIY